MMMRPLVALLLTLCAYPAWAATYWVSTTGSSQNPCTEASPCPWATAYGKSDATEIRVKGGTYTITTSWTISKAGLTVAAAAGETPVLDGAASYPLTDIYGGLLVISADNVTINGIRTTRSRANGILISCGSDNVTIKNTKTYYNWECGIKVGCSSLFPQNLVFEDGEVYRNVMRKYYNTQVAERPIPQCGVGQTPANTGGACWNWEEALWPSQFQMVGAYRPTIRRNKIYESYHEGLGLYKDTEGALVENNEIYGNYTVQVYASSSRHSTIRNNLIYGTADWGRGEATGQGAIVIGESWAASSNRDHGHRAYGNRVAHGWRNMDFGGAGLYYSAWNCFSYNNVFAEAWTRLGSAGAGYSVTTCTATNCGEGNILKNNAFLQSRDTVAVNNDPARATETYNLWSRSPGTNSSGPGDVVSTFNLAHSFGSALPTSGSLDPADFEFSGTDPGAEGGGTWLTTVNGNVSNSTTVPVANTGYFHGDEALYFQGGVTGTISSKTTNYGTGELILTAPVTLSSGVGVQLEQFMSGSTPNIGPWDFTGTTPAPPGTITGLSCTAVNAQRVDCSWNADALAADYTLSYKANPGTCAATGLTDIANIAATSYTLENLTANQSWCWYVRGRNEQGHSASYSTVSSPTTPAVTADLLDHVFADSGLAGFTLTQAGTATVTTDGTVGRLYDPDSTTSPSDYRAMMERVLSAVGSSWTIQWKGTMTDFPTTYSATSPTAFLGGWLYNGERVFGWRVASDGLRIRLADSSWPVAIGPDGVLDTDEHTWLYQYNGSTNTLTVKRDGTLVTTVTSAGYATTGDGLVGFQAAGISTDPADLAIKWVQVCNGIGTPTPPSEGGGAGAAGELRLQLN